ncbi:MAG: MtrAB system histidine kinase MtrB [Candidatus Nanopelagicus sp.]|jgi:two-component system sensor histidine kinase MtrB
MFATKFKIRQSLSLKVLLTSVAFAIVIASVIGISVHNRVASTIINEKIAISKVETANALYLAQGHFNIARFQNDAGLNKVVQDFITSSREDGSLSGRETVILPFARSGNEPIIYQTVPTLLVLDSIPDSFREQVRQSDQVLDKRVTIRYSDGNQYPGFLIGGKLNIPRTGVYEIYYLFKLNAQYDSISVITWTLLAAGFLLVLLIGLSTQFVIRQVVAPVKQAAAVAEKFTQGDLTSRMSVSSEDELASLGNSFNEMAVSIQQQIVRLENLSMLQQRFVSDVSHELRTPLTTLRMAAEVIYQQKENFDPNIARSSELLINQIDRFELLLSDLLEVSRFDAEAASLGVVTFDVAHLLQKTVDYLHPSKSTLFEIDSPGKPIQIEGDPRRIERILRNLITNAVDHGEGKSVKIQIRESENEVAIGVRDYGLGFDEADAPFLFDRFWRADPSRARSSGGTGLGLSIALEDAKLHQGQLLAWGKPQLGAHFVLTLPKRHGNSVQSFPIPLTPTDIFSTVSKSS